MAISRPRYLSIEELLEVLSCFDLSAPIQFQLVRPHNNGEIRRVVAMKLSELRALVFNSVQDERLPGRDLEVVVPGANHKLVGHHDGVFWLEEESGASENGA